MMCLLKIFLILPVLLQCLAQGKVNTNCVPWQNMNCSSTIHCPLGRDVDEKGCPSCRCYEPCRYHQCGVNEVCHVQPVFCSDKLCGVQPQCTRKCGLQQCMMMCPYGFKTDCHNCPICYCNEPFNTFISLKFYYCEIQLVTCVQAPCPPIVYCTRKCGLQQCMMMCPYGFKTDCHNCPICYCNEPFNTFISLKFYYCEIQLVTCVQAPCPPIVYCKPYCSGNGVLLDNYCNAVTCSNNSCPMGYSCNSITALNKSYCCAM
ncbi:hypothetical protein FQA39_LY07622 [Lamprigera yunnana]|nr:hypothetical protein FQA39_LY07622 [Lamprigera yunnana]